jgi:folate-binding Fe-S cluster repair protein YgfZ
MKHRGTARKRLLALMASAGVPAPDTAVTADGKAIGEIASAYGNRGFALIRLDRLDEARAAPISAGGSVVELFKAPWLFS